MGEAALSAFLQAVFETVLNLLIKELQLEHGLENEREKLISNVELIQAVLRGAEKMQLSEPQKLWFLYLKNIGYDAMEVLDEYFYEVQRRQVIPLFDVRNSTVISALNPRRMIFRHGMAKKIKLIAGQIDDIAKKRSIFQIEVHDHTSQYYEGSSFHQSSSFPPTFVYGRQNDQEKIVKMILRCDLKPNVAVLTILGEAYIGKTTVTQLVVNDERVSRYFELRPWVHVSPEFSIQRITASIIESIEGSSFHSNNLDTLQKHLEKLLRGRRYLLVLDDYWRESWHDWEKLKHPLLNGALGSKIIVTARSRAVARELGTSESYQLRSLTQEDCWLLFCQHALGTETQAYNSADFISKKLKEEILKKCNGVPFIAASLGHRLHLEKDRSNWEAILQEENWDSNPNDFMRALRLSYAQLDSHLKPCFAYCSIIPQKYRFEEEWLVQHWMAQGFIQPQPNTADTIEATGSNFFRSLVEQSFFQRALVDQTGVRHRYSMSQMMQELALHVSADECYILEKPSKIPERVRHLTVLFEKFTDWDMFEAISQCKYLHTLLFVGGSADYQLRIPNDAINNALKRLRLLDVSDFGLTELPNSIGDLIHLRCLQLRGTKIRKLPETICDLYNLQTLGLRNCYDLEELPPKIKNLRKLRHIDLHLDDMTDGPSHNICNLNCMPEDIGLLTDLQTLSRFVTSKRSILHTHRSTIHELATLDNLRGELFISKLHLVKNVQEAAQARLASKQFLQKLELSWSDNNKQAEEIFEHLKPPTSIKELTISGYTGMACPSWLGSADYRHLVTVRLYDFKNCRFLPPLGLLPLLENLHLKCWDGLISINCSEFCGSSTASFQCLKKLHLERMDRLQRWDGDDKCAFPALHELVVDNCCKLEQLTHNLPSLTKLTMDGSPNFLGLRNFPSLTNVNVNASGEWIWGSWRSVSSPISITLCKLPTVCFPSGLGWFHTSLQRLEISHCEQLVSMPDDWPPCNLNHISIEHCPQLRELPSGIQRLRALEDMVIVDCGQLTYLPEMNGLTSLQRLEISDCGSIQSLPNTGLPRSLQFLSINNCPWLSSSCMNVGSADQVEINHIISVWIDKHQVPTRAECSRASFGYPGKASEESERI